MSSLIDGFLGENREIYSGGTGGASGFYPSPGSQGTEGAPNAPGRLDSYQSIPESNFFERFFSNFTPKNIALWFLACNPVKEKSEGPAKLQKAPVSNGPTSWKSTEVPQEKKEPSKAIVASVIDIPSPHFQPHHPGTEEIAELEKYLITAPRPLAVDDPGLIQILSHSQIFRDYPAELKALKELADGLNGIRSLGGADSDTRELLKAKKLTIEGHTDTRGAEEANQKLSQGRADVIRLFLIGFGVDAARLEAKGYGKSRPVLPEIGGPEEIQRAQEMNNRVVFQIRN